MMTLTKPFRNTVLERARSDAKFRYTILVKAINELISGDVQIGKEMLRDYINAHAELITDPP